jgi:hypothetical protein
VLLYFTATLKYPGGTQLDKESNGFSWTQNYFCNLLNENAINGQKNTAQPIALTAMGVLCVTLALFWYILPMHAPTGKTSKCIMQISGILSMFIASFLYTKYHDMVINSACFFGLIAILGTFNVLKKLQWKGLFWMGIFSLILFLLNNILYYGHGLLFYLPVVQKITFVYFLLWICCIQLQVYRTAVGKG